MFFKDRKEAGKLLAESLAGYKEKEVVIYAIPRGGIIPALEIARYLNAPLDLIITRKIGHPYNPEYAIAATAENGHTVSNEEILETIDATWLKEAVNEQRKEIRRRREKYLASRKQISPKNNIAILVDDGVATGLTMRVAIQELRHQQPKKIIVAVPIISQEIARAIQREADELVALEISPEDKFLGAVGAYYESFPPIEDEEVTTILKSYKKYQHKTVNSLQQAIKIQTEHAELKGMLMVPKNARGIVLFAHGSGSSRLSPRNMYVSLVLQKAGIATLLIDLLTPVEDQNYETRFDIELLTNRLITIAHWLQNNPSTKQLPLGLFGASTGAAAALYVAARMKSDIQAVVSRGGRPDLAMDILGRVTAPTLFIVGGNDFGVIELNRQAYDRLSSIKHFEIVEGATHLFEEQGALEKVANLARDWFTYHFEQTYKHKFL